MYVCQSLREHDVLQPVVVCLVWGKIRATTDVARFGLDVVWMTGAFDPKTSDFHIFAALSFIIYCTAMVLLIG